MMPTTVTEEHMCKLLEEIRATHSPKKVKELSNIMRVVNFSSYQKFRNLLADYIETWPEDNFK